MKHCSYKNHGIHSLQNLPFYPTGNKEHSMESVQTKTPETKFFLMLTMLPWGIVRRISIHFLSMFYLDTGSPLVTSNGVSLKPLHRRCNKAPSRKQTRNPHQIVELPKHQSPCFYTQHKIV